MKVVAILSSTLLQRAGVYRYTPLEVMPIVVGIPHYVGHPATKYLLDSALSRYTPGLFAGLEVCESYYVAQLKDPRKGAAFTVDQPNIEMSDFKWGLVTREA